MTERKKIILLSLLLPWTALGVIALSLHLHGTPLRAVVILFSLAITVLFAYVVSQMIKSKKRGAR
jgi:hypothetical protein